MSFSVDLNSLVSKYMPRWRDGQSGETDSAGIPYSSKEDVDTLRRDYEEKTRTAQDPTLESCFKYVLLPRLARLLLASGASPIDDSRLPTPDLLRPPPPSPSPPLVACSYCWALVHSRDKKDVQLGMQLVEAMLSQAGDDGDGDAGDARAGADDRGVATTALVNRRELRYLQAVGQYRRGNHLDARQTLKGLLAAHPDFRQAETLLEHVETEVVKDGLIGIGAGAAILGVVTTVAIAAASGGKRGSSGRR